MGALDRLPRMGPLLSSIQAFPFTLPPHHVREACWFCRVYAGEVEVPIRMWNEDGDKLEEENLALCRICLIRMRATLKAAEKALPKLPKVPRPKED